MTERPPETGKDRPAPPETNAGRRVHGAASAVGLSRSIALSRAVLYWEEAERRFWPALAFALICIAIAATGLLPDLNPWVHTGILSIAGLSFAGLLFQGFRRFTPPTGGQARRRLERVNGLEHRPLETLSDKPSSGDPIQTALWQEHRRRLAGRLAALDIGIPAPQLARRDPFALRMAAGFLAVIALVAAGNNAAPRLVEALTPQFGTAQTALTASVDAWLAPPDYTGLPPQFIARSEASEDTPTAETTSVDGADGTDDIPVGPQDYATPTGSRLVAQVSGIGDAVVDLVTPSGRFTLAPFANDAVAIDHALDSSGPVSIQADGETLASWTIHVTPDNPPEVTLPETPVPSLQRALTLIHTVSDDYGIASLSLEIERADRPAGSAKASPYDQDDAILSTPLPVPDPSKYGKVRRVYRDYTAHPWAGGEVRLTLVAKDALGQEGRSEPVVITLPGRFFAHPVAQAIIDQRRELAWDPARNFVSVAEILEEIAWHHADYDNDVTVFLALREAVNRLIPKRHRGREFAPPTRETVDAVVDLLWKTALHLEDGGVSLALARLRAAEQALMEAMARGAEMEELERLMDELQTAMQDYIDAMTDQLQDRMAEGEEIPELNPDANIMTGQDLNDMMEQLREMMRNGMTESAAQMLEQLRRMMENMQAGVQRQMSPQGKEARDMMDRMRDIMEGQRELMDRTHNRSQAGRDGQGDPNRNGDGQPGDKGQQGQMQQGQNGKTGNSEGDADSVLQNALRRQLGEIMRRYGEMMGDIPEPFGRADEGMAESGERLKGGDPRGSLDAQGKAMDALQDAAQAAQQAFMERFENQLGLGQTTPGQSDQRSVDPFGRQASENRQGPIQGDVTVPDKGGLERAREIRDELRRRAGDRDRPSEELDYIDRLLDQFR